MDDFDSMVVMDEDSDDGAFNLKLVRTDKPFSSDHHHGRLTVTVNETKEVIFSDEVGLTFGDVDGMMDSIDEWFELAAKAVDEYKKRRLQ